MASEGSPLRGSSELAGAVNEMQRMLHELRAAQDAMRRKNIVALVLVLLIVVGFGVAAYARLRDNFEAQRLQKAAASRVQLLLPQMEPPLTATLREVAPYYMEMARDRFAKLAPRLDARVQTEADRLGKELEKQLQAQLNAYFARLDKHAAAELGRNFPALAGTGGEAAGKRVHELLTAQATRLEAEGKALYDSKAQEVRQSLSRFPVQDVKLIDLDSLNRQLLHDLLMLADYEMTAHGSDVTVAQAGASK